ncbi:helix-turn-helix domain-containing protein [Micrococcus sp. 2A]|uniref:helix-turn-helix domain-containing protein n=1 Tax=Micrococcus sp. 2A TaxID=3142261 RepID=UPI0031B9B6D0
MSEEIIQSAELRGAVLTQAAARDLTDQIRTGMESIYHLIRTAYSGRAWSALGYGSWDEYVTREFGNLHLRPPLEDRQDVVLSLREVGMSTRAIAAATHLSPRTVRRELDEAGGAFAPPAGRHDVVGTDGKTYQAQQERAVPPVVQNEAAAVIEVEEAVTVLDGQSSLDDVLDMPAADFGIEPLDLKARQADDRDRARRTLAAFNGGGAAAVPMLLKAAPAVASLVSPLTGKASVADEDLHGVVWDSARCVRTLAHVLRSVGHHEGQSMPEIRSTLQDAVNDLEQVLNKIEEVA